MNKYLYPDDWQAVAFAIKDACNWTCQQCGQQCRRPGEVWDGWANTLTVAHITQVYEGEAVCVAALCAPCHLALDAPFSWLSRQRNDRLRRHMAGQLTMTLNSP